jgi:hypothetical protein
MAISIAVGAALVAVVGFRVIYIAEAIGLLAVTVYMVAVSREPEPEPEREPAFQALADSIDGS